ncbi:MAG TPA: competence protein, partial [Mycobacterium sp.]|nr:competence protein [Mycobacterium sp.]
MSALDGREVHLDLRLVPAALTSWAVTAAGILWAFTGVLLVLSVVIAAAGATAWWGRRRGPPGGAQMTAAGVAAIALVGLGFAVAVSLRAE